MAFTFVKPLIDANKKAARANAKKTPGVDDAPAKHAKARPVIDLNQPGRLRIAHVIAFLGISRTTFHDGLKTGRYPAADGRDANMPYWNTATIKDFLEK